MRKRYIVFTALHILFAAVAPVVFVLVQYSNKTGGLAYKLPLGILLLLFVLFAVAKHTFIKPRMDKLSAQIAQHEADLKVEAQSGRIQNLIVELKRERTIETALNAVMPVIILSALLIAAKALEKSVFELSGAIGFSLASYALGTVFGILAARCVWAKHEGG